MQNLLRVGIPGFSKVPFPKPPEHPVRMHAINLTSISKPFSGFQEGLI